MISGFARRHCPLQCTNVRGQIRCPNIKGRAFQQDPPWHGTEETGQGSTRNRHPESSTRQINRLPSIFIDLDCNGHGLSAQAGDVVGHRLDFAIVHLGGDLRHLHAVLANTVTEMPPTGPQRSRHAGQPDAGTGPECRHHSGCGNRHRRQPGDPECRRGRCARPGSPYPCPWQSRAWLSWKPASSADILHVLVAERGSKALHDGVGALAGLELLQLLDQVLGMLLGQLGVGRIMELPSAP